MGRDSRNLAAGGQASCHFKWPDAKLLAVQAQVMFYTLCSPESVAFAPHWSALPTLLMRSLDTCRAYTTHPLSSAVSPAWGHFTWSRFPGSSW